MGNYTTFLMFENPRRGRQARNFTENDPKILDLKSYFRTDNFPKIVVGCPWHGSRNEWNAQTSHE